MSVDTIQTIDVLALCRLSYGSRASLHLSLSLSLSLSAFALSLSLSQLLHSLVLHSVSHSRQQVATRG